MPKVSIIVPCYNVASFLPKCLDSLINQTLHDIEIICIDDKSTDTTLNILQKYKQTDPRIKVIASENNTGVATTRNKGLDFATGEYIGFVDPDDYVDLDFYEKLYNHATMFNTIVTKASVMVTDMITGETGVHYGVKQVKKHIAYFSSAFWSAIYLHDFLQQHQIKFPDNMVYAEDAVFLAHVCTKTNNIGFVDNTAYHYFHKRPDSLDSDFFSHEKAQSALTAIKLNLARIEAANIPPHDLVRYLDSHVLNHLQHGINKKFENNNDRYEMFTLLHHAYKTFPELRNLIKNRFTRRTAHYIAKNNYGMYTNFVCYRRKRFYLLGLIPIVKHIKYTNSSYWLLLDYIPLLRVKDGRKFFLFNFILILKARG